MKNLSVIALILTLVFPLALKAQEEGVKFQEGTWEELLEKAKKQGKPFFVDFYATWCGPCKQMSKITFNDPEVAKIANESFLSYKVDTDKNQRLGSKYSIKYLPTIVFFDPKGEELGRFTGFRQASDFIAEMKKYNKAAGGKGIGGKDKPTGSIEDYLKTKREYMQSMEDILFPGNIKLYRQQALEYGRKKSDFEYEEFKANIAKEYDNSKVWLLDASYALGSKDYEKYIKIVNGLYSDDKLSPMELDWLAWQCYDMSEIPHEPMRWLNTALRLMKTPDILETKAAMLYKDKKYKDSLAVCKEAFKLAKNDGRNAQGIAILRELNELGLASNQ